MEINGIITAMVTPFDQEQNLNLDAAFQLADRLIDHGVHGLFLLGSNGEFHVLSDEEKIEFAKAVIRHVNKRVPVYVGTGACGTLETIRMAKKMEEIGADALSVITPYFIPPTQEELISHFRAIAESVNIPIILYNIPKFTGVNIDPDTLATLLEIKNIAAIKDSSGNLDNLRGYIHVSEGTDFAVLVGSDSKILPALKMGAKGAVSATSNVITDTVLSVYHHYFHGEIEEAEKAQKDIEIFRKVLKLGTVPSVLKASLSMLGIQAGHARFPVQPVSNESKEKIREALNYYQLRM